MRFSLWNLMMGVTLFSIACGLWRGAYQAGFDAGNHAQWYGRDFGSDKEVPPAPIYGWAGNPDEDIGIVLFDKSGKPWWHVYISSHENVNGEWTWEIRPCGENGAVTDGAGHPQYEGCGSHSSLKKSDVIAPKAGGYVLAVKN